MTGDPIQGARRRKENHLAQHRILSRPFTAASLALLALLALALGRVFNPSAVHVASNCVAGIGVRMGISN